MNPELSRPWSQVSPRKASDALQDLSDLHAECTPAQRSCRDVAFAQAKRFIEQAMASHGVGPIRESFPRKRRGGDPTVRVDIEVLAGMAFVP